MLVRKVGYDVTADEEDNDNSHLEIIIHHIDETNAGVLQTLTQQTIPDVLQTLTDIVNNTQAGWTGAIKFPIWGAAAGIGSDGCSAGGDQRLERTVADDRGINMNLWRRSSRHAGGRVPPQPCRRAGRQPVPRCDRAVRIAQSTDLSPLCQRGGGRPAVNGLPALEQAMVAALVTLLSRSLRSTHVEEG